MDERAFSSLNDALGQKSDSKLMTLNLIIFLSLRSAADSEAGIYPSADDFVFPSMKLRGSQPRSASMLVAREWIHIDGWSEVVVDLLWLHE